MKDDRIYLLHIRDAIDRILSYTAGGRSEFFNDAKTQDAVIRNIEIIGEAVEERLNTTEAGPSRRTLEENCRKCEIR